MDKDYYDLTDNREIGKHIKMLCAQKGISFKELARQADISPAALYNLFSGKGNPRLSTLTLIAHTLGVSLGQLLSYELYDLNFNVSDQELFDRIKKMSDPDKRLVKMYLDIMALR